MDDITRYIEMRNEWKIQREDIAKALQKKLSREQKWNNEFRWRIIKMKKIYCIIVQTILLLWFFLDMIGLKLGDKIFVTKSYKEDGIFF